jgi:hypothetical protein
VDQRQRVLAAAATAQCRAGSFCSSGMTGRAVTNQVGGRATYRCCTHPPTSSKTSAGSRSEGRARVSEMSQAQIVRDRRVLVRARRPDAPMTPRGRDAEFVVGVGRSRSVLPFRALARGDAGRRGPNDSVAVPEQSALACWAAPMSWARSRRFARCGGVRATPRRRPERSPAPMGRRKGSPRTSHIGSRKLARPQSGRCRTACARTACRMQRPRLSERQRAGVQASARGVHGDRGGEPS